MKEKSVSFVPKWIALALTAGIGLQILLHATIAPVSARAENLAAPPSIAALKIMSLGEPVLASKLLALYLQSFDIQPGIVIPYRNLDYDMVEKWLKASLELDEKGQYPLFAASHFYAMVNSPPKARKMLDFVHREFEQDPDNRWQWQAIAVVLAKHELQDLPLALKYAESLRLKATGRDVAPWAKEMSLFLLEDMNELQSAKIVLGGLLAAGKIADPNEISYLQRELERLEAVEKPSPQTESRQPPDSM